MRYHVLCTQEQNRGSVKAQTFRQGKDAQDVIVMMKSRA